MQPFVCYTPQCAVGWLDGKAKVWMIELWRCDKETSCPHLKLLIPWHWSLGGRLSLFCIARFSTPHPPPVGRSVPIESTVLYPSPWMAFSSLQLVSHWSCHLSSFSAQCINPFIPTPPPPLCQCRPMPYLSFYSHHLPPLRLPPHPNKQNFQWMETTS